MADRTLEWSESRSAAERGDYDHQMYRGIALSYLDRLDEAASAFRGAIARAPEDSVPALAIWAHALLGMTEAKRGDMREVRRIEDWLAIDREPWGWGSFFRACIAAQLGHRPEAVALLRQAFGEGLYRNPPQPRLHRYDCFDTLADYEPFRELIRPRG